MGRYISRQSLSTYLNLGKIIEVFLGRINDNKKILSYLEIKNIASDKIQLSTIEHYDEGSLDWLDIYDFSYVDPDGNHNKIEFDNIEEAIDFIQVKFQLKEIKFVNEGIIQDEYKDLLISEGQS